MRTIDGGLTWNSISLTGGNDLDFPSSSIGYMPGDLGAVYKTTDGGANWTQQTTPTSFPLYSIDFTSIDTGYAVGGNGFSGVILKTVDGGVNWTISLSDPNNFQSVRFSSPATGFACGQSGIIYKYSMETGINNLSKAHNITIYPNPSNGSMILSYSMKQNDTGILKFFNVAGGLVKEYAFNSTDNNINLSTELTNGFYLYKVIINGTIIKSDKIVIVN